MALRSKTVVAVALATIAVSAVGAEVAPTRSTGAARAGGWVTSWAQSQQDLAHERLHDQSVRMIVRLSQGGDRLRIRVQNQFGATSLHVGAAAVAASDGRGPGVRRGTRRPLTFHHRRAVTVPAGRGVWSDPVRLRTVPRGQVAVSLYLPGDVRPGEHDLALRRNYLSRPGSGNQVGDLGGAAFTQRVRSTYLVSAVDVHNSRLRGTIVALGSSVVDGSGSANCGPGCVRSGNDQRWTDDLAHRIVTQLPARRQFAVADAGIGETTSAPGCPREPARVRGLEAGSRLDRDVFALHGVRAVIYYGGMNDLGFGCTAGQVLASYRAVFGRLRRAGVAVFVVPPTPRHRYDARQNRYREQVDAWVRAGGNCGGACSGVLDFARVVEDRTDHGELDPRYDNGDGVHVDIAGQRAEADSIPLRRLTSSA